MIKRTEGEELLEAQREKMSTEEAKAVYRLRSQTVELGFGDAKGNRRVDRRVSGERSADGIDRGSSSE